MRVVWAARMEEAELKREAAVEQSKESQVRPLPPTRIRYPRKSILYAYQHTYILVRSMCTSVHTCTDTCVQPHTHAAALPTRILIPAHWY